MHLNGWARWARGDKGMGMGMRDYVRGCGLWMDGTLTWWIAEILRV